MSGPLPTIFESSNDEKKSILDDIELARRIRENAAERVARRFAEIKPDTRRWRTGEDITLPAEPLRVL